MFCKKFLNLNFFLWLFFYIFIFSLALNITFSFFDLDFPWHLRIGQQIINEKSAPTIDYYNHTLENRSWVDHEWLFNAFFFYTFSKFGYIFLNIFFAGIVTLIFIILNFFTQTFFINKFLNSADSQKQPKNNFNKGFVIIMALEIYALIAMSPLLGVRMQIVGNLFFLLLLLLLEIYNKNKQKIYLLILIPLFILWANIHGTFLVGLAVLWTWVGLKTIENYLLKLNIFHNFQFNPLNRRDILFAYIFSFSATLGTLINPYGINLYSFLNTYQNSFYLTAILEWRPFYYLPILYNQLIIMAIFLAITLLSLYQLSKKNIIIDGFKKYVKKINFWYLFLSLLFFVLALKSKRHFPLFLISSFALIIQFLYFEFAMVIKIKFFSKLVSISKIIIIFIFAILSIHFINTANINNNPFLKSSNYPLPYDMINFLKNNPDLSQKKIFNDYSWGGYFLWEMPKRKLFIDGRMPQINYKNHSLLEEYMEFSKKNMSEKKLKEYHIELVLYQKEPPFNFNFIEKKIFKLDEKKLNSTPSYLENFLNSSPNWNKIYEDNMAEIFTINKNF